MKLMLKMKNTQRSTNSAWKTFSAYCNERKLDINIESCSKMELDGVLKDFYTATRKETVKCIASHQLW